MRREPSRGFTLVEFVVCLFVLVLIVGLMLPALGTGARRSSRRTTCINNMRNVGLALIQFESAKGRFPGWKNSQNPDADGYGGTATGWVFPLLPYLDRNDLYATYGPAGDRPNAVPTEHLKVMVCPDDAAAIRNGTNASYVVNSGRYGTPGTNDDEERRPAIGVFFDNYPYPPDQQPDPEYVRMTMRYINGGDGAATTLLISENVDAGRWTDADERCVGFTWTENVAQPGNYRMNAATETDECQADRARPSSFHGGGVVATFCDGHTQFLSEDMDYEVFTLLMTPRGAENVSSTGGSRPQTRQLTEGDY